MKVIDLLNRIANGEECPKKLIKGEYTLKFIDDYNLPYYSLINNNNGVHLGEFYFNISNLNDEVEIIEEEKEIEKLEPLKKDWMTLNDIKFTFSNSEMILVKKINELIDIVNKMRKEK